MNSSLVEATSGALAALVATALVYPVDTVVVRYQTTVGRKVSKPAGEPTWSSTVQRLLTIIRDIATDVPEEGTTAVPLHQKKAGRSGPVQSSAQSHRSRNKTESQDREDTYPRLIIGISKFYHGLGVKLLEQLVRNFIYFYIYRSLKNFSIKKTGGLTAGSTLLLASIAASITQLITTPLDFAATSTQLSQKRSSQVLKNIYEKEGLLGFYRGFGASMVLCSNPAITNATYDRLKIFVKMLNVLRMRYQMDPIVDDEVPVEPITVLLPLTPFQTFLVGAVSKTVATVITYPYIRAKVLVQSRGVQQHRPTHKIGVEDLAAVREHSRGNILRKSGGSDSARSLKTLSHEEFSVDQGLLRAQSMVVRVYSNKRRNVQRTHSVQSASECEQGRIGDPNSASSYIAPKDVVEPPSFCLSDMAEVDAAPDDSSDGARSPVESPFIEVRSRLVDRHLEHAAHSGILDVLVSTVVQEGPGGLYKGLGLQLCKTILTASILYLVKEQSQVYTSHALKRVHKLFGVGPREVSRVSE